MVRWYMFEVCRCDGSKNEARVGDLLMKTLSPMFCYLVYLLLSNPLIFPCISEFIGETRNVVYGYLSGC
jgi:hypothetical protein